MNKEGSRKRKRNIIEVLNGTTEQSKLKIQVMDSIPCTIFQLPVYNYREIRGNDITCS